MLSISVTEIHERGNIQPSQLQHRPFFELLRKKQLEQGFSESFLTIIFLPINAFTLKKLYSILDIFLIIPVLL